MWDGIFGCLHPRLQRTERLLWLLLVLASGSSTSGTSHVVISSNLLVFVFPFLIRFCARTGRLLDVDVISAL